MLRKPPDVLITTPESLYLMLTSKAREFLVDAEAVIVDEIHAVARTKRGAHLALTLERLEAARRPAAPAHRPVRHAAPARGGRPLPRGRGPRVHGHRRRHAQAARPEDPRAGGEHARARRPRRDRPGRGRHGHGGGRRRPGRRRPGRRRPGGHDALDLAGDLPRAAAARAGAPLDDHLREQPPRRRAARRAPERAGRRGEPSERRHGRRRRPPTSRAPTTARSPARSGWSSRTCSSRASCPASWPPRRSSSASTWAPWTS